MFSFAVRVAGKGREEKRARMRQKKESPCELGDAQFGSVSPVGKGHQGLQNQTGSSMFAAVRI